MRSIFLRFFLLVILPLVAILGYVYVSMDFGLPQTSGVIQVSETKNDISLTRDKNGVAYIEATSDEDAFFGIGLAHAQDRLWQLELQRRIARGRLSEILGESALALDARMRTLGFQEIAKTEWHALSDEAKSSLSAYTKGINTRINSNDSLPIEFLFFDIKPEPWTEIDSLAWSKVFALSLSNSMWTEIARFLSIPYLTQAQRVELFEGIEDTQISHVDENVSNALTAMLEVQEDIEQRFKIGGDYVGSNAWVVSGDLGENNSSLLAGDPHVGLQIPSSWYVASLVGDKINAKGMTLVGLPIIIFGRNQNIAWGGTNMMADVQDLYFEQVNSANANLYLNDGEWMPFEVEKQYITVRPDFPTILREDTKPVEIEIRKTIRGPIVSDAFGLSDQPISLRWPALDTGGTTYESFFRLNYAQDWESFKGALAYHVSPTLNFLYSDRQGNIGYQGAGRIPMRKKGNGDIPLIGESNGDNWSGYIPFEQMPHIYNPKQGYIVSANNNMMGEQYPYHISYDWAPSARADRIAQLLEQKIRSGEKLTVEYMKEMQGDTVSFGAHALIDLLVNTPMQTEEQKQAQQYLASWNGDMSADSQAAAIFYSWSRFLRIVLYSDEFKAPYGRAKYSGLMSSSYMNVTYDQIAQALTKSDANWCDDVTTEGLENCDVAIQKALNMAISQLTKLVGSDMEDWQWGEVHTTVYKHTPFSEVNMLKDLFERRIASSGGPNTINVGTANFVESEGFEQYFGAAHRQIIELGENAQTHFYMNSTGQSENVFSEYYDDMIEPFNGLQFLELPNVAKGTQLVLKNANTTNTKQ
ncbi:penicillin acylase family protein [Pseudoalteromonas sp. JBTF-M23]|uniref:Penicillin acylase family protein n=1 Tax=Pseudoalteromonas caenipelagi TaxID=2726988 RepID=A0A849VDE4_9GAMM|nr:penicillin acylase family protein [Pseudoalteromonas caenipelagi]NOU51326.1 penicillin acylase family protein [Pseudoalteromonas caenipelagi]